MRTLIRIIGIGCILSSIIYTSIYFITYYNAAQTTLCEQQQEIRRLTSVQESDALSTHLETDHGDARCILSLVDLEQEYVVYENEEDNYYLHRNKDGVDTRFGEIYTNDYKQQPLIVYGHNMINGTMFGSLDKLAIGSHVKVADVVYADNIETEYTVQDMVVVEGTQVYDTINATDTDLVLVTCNYGKTDGRMLVFCSKIDFN